MTSETYKKLKSDLLALRKRGITHVRIAYTEIIDAIRSSDGVSITLCQRDVATEVFNTPKALSSWCKSHIGTFNERIEYTEPAKTTVAAPKLVKRVKVYGENIDHTRYKEYTKMGLYHLPYFYASGEAERCNGDENGENGYDLLYGNLELANLLQSGIKQIIPCVYIDANSRNHKATLYYWTRNGHSWIWDYELDQAINEVDYENCGLLVLNSDSASVEDAIYWYNK